MSKSSLYTLLSTHTREGTLYTKLPEDCVQCLSCGHRCKIPPNKDGICKVRSNRDGKLFVPHGYVSGIALDPIEKKPFFHVYPGSEALSFGMLGCDYHCSFCQNWITSQSLRDPQAVSSIQKVTANEIVTLALRNHAPVITSTYNEPLITTEWSLEIFKQAKLNGLLTSYVSNGNGTPEALESLLPWIDFYKVDLKAFRQKSYQQMGGVLQHVLDTIQYLVRHNIWVEVVTLIIPGMNDSKDELADIARFVFSVSPDIPWHVTAYHEDYKMESREKYTSALTLLRAAEIGYSEGLHYVYTGNLPGQTKNFENTYCYSCNELLIERKGFRILQNYLTNGCCRKCKSIIAGRWKPDKQTKQ